MSTSHFHCRLLALLLLPGFALSCGSSDTPTEDQLPAADAPNLDAGVSLSADQVSNSGIRVEPPRIKDLTRSLVFPAMAEADLDRQSHVNAAVPGVVIGISAELGQDVETGQPLCRVQSPALAEAAAELRQARASLESTTLMRERELTLLQRGIEVAKAALDRQQASFDSGFGSATSLSEAQAAYQTARLALESRQLELERQSAQEANRLTTAESRLAAWGFSAGYADSEDGRDGSFTILARQGGVILERHITLGEFVDSGDHLFLIQDMNLIWMLASVFETQIAAIDEGVDAIVRFHAFPELTIRGTVDHIHHDLDPETRSVHARVKVANMPMDGRSDPHPLLPGMYGSIEIETAHAKAATVVPTRSLQRDGETDYLFTLATDGLYRRRMVQIGLRTREEAEVLSGLPVGEEVVVEGVFILESLLHAEEIGEE